MDPQLKAIIVYICVMVFALYIWIYLNHIKRGLIRIQKIINEILHGWEEP